MRSKHFFAMGVVSGGFGLLGALGTGCGGGTVNNNAGGSTSTSTTATTTSASSTHTSTHSATIASSSGNGGSVGNGGAVGTGGTGGSGGGAGGAPPAACAGTTFATAVPLTVGAMPLTTAEPDVLTPCYFSFTGKAGDRYVFQALAEGLFPTSHNNGDPAVTDTVVTLYLPDKTTIWARNDDAWPRTDTDSTLFSELPMDGTYYLQVMDCNALHKVNPLVSCNPAMGVTDKTFSIFAGDMTANASKGAELIGSTTTPQTVTYSVPTGAMKGQYGTVMMDGDVTTATDVEVFNFTPPADTTVDPTARTRAYFWVQSLGATDGDGSSDNVLVTATDMAGHVLAQADQFNYDNGDDPMNGSLQFSFPLDDQFGNGLNKPFKLSVAVSPSASLVAMKQFYIIEHFVGPYFYGTEDEEGPTGSGKNDVPSMAQGLNAPTGQTGVYHVDGNLSSPTDVDWFSTAVPSTAKGAYFQCSAARDGSGLLGFTATLYTDTAGTKSLITLGPEKSPAKVDLTNLNVMGGAPFSGAPPATVLMKVSATGQSTTVAGTFYHCDVFYQ